MTYSLRCKARGRNGRCRRVRLSDAGLDLCEVHEEMARELALAKCRAMARTIEACHDEMLVARPTTNERGVA